MLQDQVENSSSGNDRGSRQRETRRGSNRKVDQHSLTLARHLLSDRTLGDHPVIGITSCSLGEGVSTIAANLAAAAGTICAGQVLLIDATPLKPTVAKRFRCSKSPGWFAQKKHVERQCDEHAELGRQLNRMSCRKARGPPRHTRAQSLRASVKTTSRH